MPALAKLTRPKTHKALHRERLFAQLDELRHCPLVWIASPPGAGKTTLVSSYIQNRKLRSMWFQLDAGDDDLATFFHYLAQAAPPGKRAAELPKFLPGHRADLPGFCRLFFRALYSRASAPLVLALDNYHELDLGSPLHGLLQQIVAEVPDGHCIVVMSRAEPPRELAPLRLSGKLVTLDRSLLRLSLDESRALAAEQSPVDEGWLRRVHRLTDGWAAGVALSAQRQALAGDTPAAPEGDDTALLFDYFAAQLLRDASPELQRFLVRTSLLTTFTAESADQMNERSDSANLLEDLYRRGMFTTRRDTRPPVYQFHDLLRRFLRVQFELTLPPDERLPLQRRAGRLLEGAGQTDHAIRLYLEIGDWDDAKRVLLAAAPTFLAQARTEALRDWILRLPASHAEDPWVDYWLGAALARLTPPLARAPLARAWRALEGRDEIPLRRLLCADMILTYAFEYSDFSPLDLWGNALLELLRNGHPFSSVVEELHVETACAFALGQRLPRAAEMQRCVTRMLQLIEHESVPSDLAAIAAGFVLVQHFSLGSLREGARIARLLETFTQKPDLSPMAKALSGIQLGHMALRTGDGPRARAALLQGLEVARTNALDLPMLRIFSNLGLAFEALQRGDLVQAEVHRRAMEEASTPDRKTDQVGMLRVRFWIACHRGQWELAHSLAETQLRLTRECGLFVVLFESYILLAYVCAQTQREAQMESALADVDRLITGTAFEHFRYQSDLARAYLALLAGNRGACHRSLAAGLAGSRGDEGRFMLRMQPRVLSSLLGEALQAGIDVGYATQLITEMGLPPPAATVEQWPWPIRIYALGRFEIHRDDQPLEFSRKAPKKTLALLKAIIANGGSSVREQRLLDIFWSDEEGDVAARSLTAALHRLRGLLGDNDAVIQQGGTLSLNFSRVWVDALALDALLGSGAPVGAERLLELYRGSFLEEDEGEPWSVTARERLRSRFNQALGLATAALERERNYELAIDCYLRGIDCDPVIESFYQGLMRCYASTGRRAEAVAAYLRLKHILSVALSLKPSAATEALAAEIRISKQ
jgi:ATP/maltotriose-dependent transcriptional regulator MalT/DNA-binding SARP family transcriptional activator